MPITFELGGAQSPDAPVQNWSRSTPPDFIKLALLDGPIAEVRQVYTDGSFVAWRIGGLAGAPARAQARKAKAAAPKPESPVTTVHSFKIPRRGEIKQGTELTVEGIRGRVRFVQACFNRDSGKEWIDVIHVRTGKSRVIDPAKIKTVHR